jgi:hypothetical protein
MADSLPGHSICLGFHEVACLGKQGRTATELYLGHPKWARTERLLSALNASPHIISA